MQLHNYMEDVVEKILDEMLVSLPDLCRCSRCKLDILALTLNRLKPKYIVTQKGMIYSKLHELDIQFRADITREITLIAEHIKKNPRHEQ